MYCFECCKLYLATSKRIHWTLAGTRAMMQPINDFVLSSRPFAISILALFRRIYPFPIIFFNFSENLVLAKNVRFFRQSAYNAEFFIKPANLVLLFEIIILRKYFETLCIISWRPYGILEHIAQEFFAPCYKYTHIFCNHCLCDAQKRICQLTFTPSVTILKITYSAGSSFQSNNSLGITRAYLLIVLTILHHLLCYTTPIDIC